MTTHAASWYPDPHGRHQYRWYDGNRWTDAVSDDGVQGHDPVLAPPPLLDRIETAMLVGNEADPERIATQVRGTDRQGANVQQVAFEGTGSIFDEPVLVVNQKAKVIELANQYGVFDQHGRLLAAVNEIGQSKTKKAMRLLTSFDQFMTHRLEITDTAGAVLLRLTRPAKWMKSTVVVADGQDREIGRIVQDNVFGKIHFTLQAGEHTYGAIKAENWRAWDFRIEDHTGTEVARITKTWEGLAKTLFTTADNYVVQLHARLPQPLLSLVVASALSVDTALKQDSRGLG